MSDDFELNPSSKEQSPSVFSKMGTIIATIFSPLIFILAKLPRKLRIITIIVSVASLVIGGLYLKRPQAQKRPTPETVVTVEVIQTERADYPIVVNTNGTIQAAIRGNLVSQIRGEIVKVSDKFKNGGAFSSGDVLIHVDDRDYRAEISQALSAVSQAKAALKQEQALAKQARIDWQRLGNAGSPPSLVAREPQLAAARAQTDSAQARYETASLNLERTKIKAPYNGRVIQRNAVPGQYVSIGSNLAEIFATEGVEVRLPVSQDEYAQLGLETLTGERAQQFKVEISSQLGPRSYRWDALVTRADSTFDLTTRQINVIAEVVAPFSTDGSKPSLKIGQFVNARILGRTLPNVITVPNKALREGSYVFTSQDNKLVRTPVTLSWQDDKNAVIDTGLNMGDIVVTTSLNSTLAGASVKYQDSEIPSIASSAEKTTQVSTEISTTSGSEALNVMAETDTPSTSPAQSDNSIIEPASTDGSDEPAASSVDAPSQ